MGTFGDIFLATRLRSVKGTHEIASSVCRFQVNLAAKEVSLSLSLSLSLSRGLSGYGRGHDSRDTMPVDL